MHKTAVELIKSPNRFEEYFGGLGEIEREKVIAVLRTFMADIRVALERAGRMTEIVSPELEERCATCAFNPVTDKVKGFGPTAHGLLWAITNDSVFLCHDDQPHWKENLLDPSKPVLCNGFHSVRVFRGAEAHHAALRANATIARIVLEGK